MCALCRRAVARWIKIWRNETTTKGHTNKNVAFVTYNICIYNIWICMIAMLQCSMAQCIWFGSCVLWRFCMCDNFGSGWMRRRSDACREDSRVRLREIEIDETVSACLSQYEHVKRNEDLLLLLSPKNHPAIVHQFTQYAHTYTRAYTHCVCVCYACCILHHLAGWILVIITSVIITLLRTETYGSYGDFIIKLPRLSCNGWASGAALCVLFRAVHVWMNA